jgi:hypothetical protein
MMRSRMAVPLALFGTFAQPAIADILPIERGYYVSADTPCGDASNATINLYTGKRFGSAHEECRSPTVKRLNDGSFEITESCRDTQGRGGPWQSEKTTYRVKNRTEFTMTDAYARYEYRLCRQQELPEPWRSTAMSGSRTKPD